MITPAFLESVVPAHVHFACTAAAAAAGAAAARAVAARAAAARAAAASAVVVVAVVGAYVASLPFAGSSSESILAERGSHSIRRCG